VDFDMGERPVIKLGRVEHAFYQAGVKHGSGYSLSGAAEQLRKAAEHYKNELDDEDVQYANWLSEALYKLAHQLDTQAESEKKDSAKQLNFALKMMNLKSPSLRHRCKNAIIGCIEGFRKG
jgi:hypothetical protein